MPANPLENKLQGKPCLSLSVAIGKEKEQEKEQEKCILRSKSGLPVLDQRAFKFPSGIIVNKTKYEELHCEVLIDTMAVTVVKGAKGESEDMEAVD